MVNSTSGGNESLDAVRHCEVELNGKPGRVTERCFIFEPMDRIGWLMTEESFGMAKMFDGIGFDFVLEELGPDTTRVLNTSFYRPRNLLGSLMSALVMKRSFENIRLQVLANLKRLAEDSPPAPAPRAARGPL